MKDVVSENPHFDVDTFISLLRDRIYSKDGYARQFLVSWVSIILLIVPCKPARNIASVVVRLKMYVYLLWLAASV